MTSQKDPRRDHASSPPDESVHGLDLQPTMARPVAAGKLYLMQSVHLQSQGPFTSRGLSYCELINKPPWMDMVNTHQSRL
jgi:hypothetical protein